MKRHFFESRDYPLQNIDGALEARDQPDTGLPHDRPQQCYDTSVRLLGFNEDATPADLYEIVTDLNRRLGFCRPLTANELYRLVDQHRDLSIGRDLFVVGSAVREMAYDQGPCEPSWVRWEARREQLPKSLIVFQYPMAIHPRSAAWSTNKIFEGGCNQRIPIIVTKPSPLVGAGLGTFAL